MSNAAVRRAPHDDPRRAAPARPAAGTPSRRGPVAHTGTQDRPRLTLVTGGRRRWAGAATLFVAFIVVALVVVAGRVHMASQQIELDRLNNDVRRARTYFDTLRSERARLLSPENLIAEAVRAGMKQGTSNRIVEVDRATAVFIASRVGALDPDLGARVESPLDEFGRIKAAVAGAK